MWILVFYDLPTFSKEERKAQAQFRKDLMSNGFIMFQFSIYVRHCSSMENAEVHMRRILNYLPSKGKVGIMCITDRQFGMMKLYFGKKVEKLPEGPGQLTLF
ncbi:MAG: CRISPR-associated endonuclease Cas2 [Saprospiraceae bacterium]